MAIYVDKTGKILVDLNTPAALNSYGTLNPTVPTLATTKYGNNRFVYPTRNHPDWFPLRLVATGRNQYGDDVTEYWNYDFATGQYQLQSTNLTVYANWSGDHVYFEVSDMAVITPQGGQQEVSSVTGQRWILIKPTQSQATPILVANESGTSVYTTDGQLVVRQGGYQIHTYEEEDGYIQVIPANKDHVWSVGFNGSNPEAGIFTNLENATMRVLSDGRSTTVTSLCNTFRLDWGQWQGACMVMAPVTQYWGVQPNYLITTNDGLLKTGTTVIATPSHTGETSSFSVVQPDTQYINLYLVPLYCYGRTYTGVQQKLCDYSGNKGLRKQSNITINTSVFSFNFWNETSQMNTAVIYPSEPLFCVFTCDPSNWSYTSASLA